LARGERHRCRRGGRGAAQAILLEHHEQAGFVYLARVDLRLRTCVDGLANEAENAFGEMGKKKGGEKGGRTAIGGEKGGGQLLFPGGAVMPMEDSKSKAGCHGPRTKIRAKSHFWTWSSYKESGCFLSQEGKEKRPRTSHAISLGKKKKGAGLTLIGIDIGSSKGSL